MDDINGKIRLAGYKDALKEAGINYSEGLVLNQNTVMMMVMPWQNV